MQGKQVKEKKKRVSVEEKMGLTAFLRRPPIYLLFYGYATSRRDEHPAESWMETIRQFKKRYGIHDEIEIDEAIFRTVFKMTADLINERIYTKQKWHKNINHTSFDTELPAKKPL